MAHGGVHRNFTLLFFDNNSRFAPSEIIQIVECEELDN